MIGSSEIRKEDRRLVLGKGQFTDDHVAAGTLFAGIVRSPYPSARINGVDKATALEEGAHSVWVFGDLPSLSQPLPAFREPATNPYCDLMAPPAQLALADGVVRYVGEPVAVVLADSPALAENLADQLAVDYELLDPVIDPEIARQDDIRVHEASSNTVAHLSACIGDVDAAFSGADIVVEKRFTFPRIASMPIETRAISAEYDAGKDSMTIRVGHQIPYAVKGAASRFTGLREESIQVLSPDTGGAFGPKSGVYPEDVLVPLLSYMAKRPVKWIQTRSEFMLSSQHARDQIIDVRLAAKSDGQLLGLDVSLIKDTGAYLCWAVIEPTNTINHVPSQYRLPAYRAEAVSVLTNKCPSSPYRGTGRPEATWIIERSLDFLGHELGISPIEIRRRNLVSAAEMPYKPGNVYRDGVEVVYDTGDFPKVFEATLGALDGQLDALRRSAPANKRIGMGVANYVEASGIGWPCEGATVKIDEGGRAEVWIGVSQSGQGHETVFAQICSEYLGMPYDRIRVRGGDSRLLHYSYGTGGSRVTVNTGNAVAMAAADVRRRTQIVAGGLLGCAPEKIVVSEGAVFEEGKPDSVVDWARLVSSAAFSRVLAGEPNPGLCATKYYYPPTVTWASGTHAAIVEVDIDTGEWKIVRYAIGHDCGRQINPKLVEGQIWGAFAQGLGTALGERIVYSEDGQLLSGSLMDYVMPRAVHIPDIEMLHFEFLAQSNPLGVRGVGEGNVGPVPAAIAGAISDAFGGRIEILVPMMTAAEVCRLTTGITAQ
ncbi:MAG: xanthine dehydrogenase family protein [Nitratireductor sp.]|nr:xanthine dehydrogenase family protein [Nitratireductor sp.]